MRHWAIKPGRVMAAVLLVAAIALAEFMVNPALAASRQGRWPGGPHSTLGYPTAIVTGMITEVGDGSVTVQPEASWVKGRWPVQLPPTAMTFISDTVVFDHDLVKVASSALVTDTTISAAPIPIWGQLQAQWIFLGTLDELSDYSYRGNLLEATGDSLRLAAPWGDEITIQVNADTVWVDGGQFGRPANLPTNVALQILGKEAEDGTITAVLVTGGYARW